MTLLDFAASYLLSRMETANELLRVRHSTNCVIELGELGAPNGAEREDALALAHGIHGSSLDVTRSERHHAMWRHLYVRQE